MTKEEILNGNKLIAEFMGAKRMPHNSKLTPTLYEFPESIGNTNTHKWATDYLIYHKSWDWIMPVVEKIENLGYIVSITGHNCRIEGDHVLFTSIRYNKMHSTHETVLEFIQWYNKNLET
jgi:hypothetical protein